jgi:hypothetical protein
MKINEVFTRIFLSPSELDKTIHFYEDLFGQKCDVRFNYPEKGLELASVASCLLIAGSDDHLGPFRETKVTYLVDSLDDFKEFLLGRGATLLEEPKSIPTGKNMRVKHPDGLVVEYVELETDGGA